MIPYEFDAERFSRWMAYVLRHNPERYGLQPDKHGFVDLDTFIQIAKRRYPNVTPEQLREFISLNGAARFEVSGAQLRARYGHSIPVEPVGPAVEPPEHLFFGTEAAKQDEILAQGLQPVERRNLHLSTTVDEALSIASRKAEQPAVFRILAKEAHQAGVAFYRESSLYLASRIPAEFIRLERLPQSSGQPA
jgi:putative RNA 2'-phosphotransferase